MADTDRALDLLRQAVPLALLFDLAGFAPSSEEILRTERSASEGTTGQRLVAAVAS